jgi:hypothetical protein
MHELRACLSMARISHGRPKDLPKHSQSQWIHVAANLLCPRSEIICIMQSRNCSSTQRTPTLTPVCALHLIQTAKLPGMRYRPRITTLIGCHSPHQDPFAVPLREAAVRMASSRLRTPSAPPSLDLQEPSRHIVNSQA